MPPSTNELYKKGKGRIYLSPRYKLWKLAAGWEYHRQRRRIAKISGPYTLHLILSSAKRRGDCDNRLKATLDLLKGLGVTPDDRLCEKATAEWGEAPEGFCRVVLTPVSQPSRRAA